MKFATLILSTAVGFVFPAMAEEVGNLPFEALREFHTQVALLMYPDAGNPETKLGAREKTEIDRLLKLNADLLREPDAPIKVTEIAAAAVSVAPIMTEAEAGAVVLKRFKAIRGK